MHLSLAYILAGVTALSAAAPLVSTGEGKTFEDLDMYQRTLSYSVLSVVNNQVPNKRPGTFDGLEPDGTQEYKAWGKRDTVVNGMEPDGTQ